MNKNKRNLDFFPWFFGRLLFYAKAHKFPGFPWRYRWIKLFLEVLLENPIRSIKYCREFARGEIEEEGYILVVRGRKLLKDACQVCESIALKPFLIFGTLLGFVRENDFIYHDSDIDLGLLEDDFQKKDLIKEAMLKKGYKVRKVNDYGISFIHPEFPSLTLDFSRVYRENDHMIIAGLNYDQKTLFLHYFPLDIFREYRIVNFQNVKVFVPLEAEKFLTVLYGAWKIPLKEFDYIYSYKNLKVEEVK